MTTESREASVAAGEAGARDFRPYYDGLVIIGFNGGEMGTRGRSLRSCRA